MTLNKNNAPAAFTTGAIETYHGVPVPDPYRWLEDPQSGETLNWLQAQAKLTESYLMDIPARDTIREQLDRWMQRDSLQVMGGNLAAAGKTLFFQKKAAGQNQAVLYQLSLTAAGAEPRKIIDPNPWSEDATTAMAGFFPDRRGRLLAYNVSAGGSDWHSIRVRDLESGEDLPDEVRWCKSFSNVWNSDSTGFYYSGSGHLADAPPDPLSRLQVYYHRLGTDQVEDRIVYQSADPLVLTFGIQASTDWQHLVLTVLYGALNRVKVYTKPLDNLSEFIPLDTHAEGMLLYIGSANGRFYFLTDLEAPNGRVIAIDPERPQRDNWQEVVPESDPIPLAFGFSLACIHAGRVIINTLKDSANHLVAYPLDGSPSAELLLPHAGTVAALCPVPHEPVVCLAVESHLEPAALYRYDLDHNRCTPLVRILTPVQPGGYESTLVTYPSKDGVAVQMWLVQKKGVQYDGTNPVILSAYGGFSLALTPHFGLGGFGPPVAAWLEMGGIYAFAHIRGGGERGEAWHEAGKLANKQNVFNDFIAAAEWLIENKVTCKQRLTIFGTSNGGLLTAACLTQRPDLYGTVIVDVPLTDMLRYHLFTVGRYWVGEFGSAEADLEQFKTLLAYSPYHNVRPGTVYPPTMVITSEFDDRVVPAHAMKFVAALQAADAGESPILLRYEFRAGHGGGKPTYKLVEEFSDIFAFIRHTQGW